MIITAASLASLRTGFRNEFNAGFARITPSYTRVATVVPSNALSNTYGWIKDWPRLRKWIGDRVLKSIGEGSYAIENDEFEATVAVPRKYIETDNLGVYKPMMQGLGQSAAEFPDELIYQLILAGDSTACWDGQNFFDEEHPVGDKAGTTYSNLQAGAGSPWVLLDTTKPLKPFIYQERKAAKFVSMTAEEDENVFMRAEYRYGVDMSCAGGFGFPQQAFLSRAALTDVNYDAARTGMSLLKSEEGHPLGIKPNLLLHGPSNRSAAKQLFGASLVEGGGTNIWFQDIELMEVAWLG